MRGEDEFHRAKHAKQPMKARNPWVERIPTTNDIYQRRKMDPLPEASPFWILKTTQANKEE